MPGLRPLSARLYQVRQCAAFDVVSLAAVNRHFFLAGMVAYTVEDDMAITHGVKGGQCSMSYILDHRADDCVKDKLPLLRAGANGRMSDGLERVSRCTAR